MKRTSTFTVVTCLFATWASLAQAQDNCDAVLAATTIKDNSKRNISLATLDLVTEENFRDFQKQFSGSASLVYNYIPMKANSDYREFDKARKAFREEHRFDYKLNEIRDLSVSFVSDRAIEAWVTCIEQGKKEVLLLRAKHVSKTEVLIHAKWIPGASGEAGKLSGRPYVSGAEVVRIPQEFKTKWSSIHLARKGGPLVLDLELSNGDAAHIYLPAYSPIYNAPLNCIRATEAGCASCRVPLDLESGNFSGTRSFRCEGMAPSEAIAANIAIQYRVVGAQSARTHVELEARSGQHAVKFGEPSCIDPFACPSLVNRSTILRGLRTSSSGGIGVDLRLLSCRWVSDSGLVPAGCGALTLEKGSYIRFDIE